MKIALDPYMHRHLPLHQIMELAAELGYEYVELSMRTDLLPLFTRSRANKDLISAFGEASRSTGVQLVSLMAVYRWASSNEEERRSAVSNWKRAIQLAIEMGCSTMNSEFGGKPDEPIASEASFWRSVEELLPLFEREGIALHLEPHPGDFVEDSNAAVDIIRAIGSDNVKYLYCAPHTFHMGDDMAAMIRYAKPVLAHVHVADTFNQKGSSGLRYIVNPIGAPVRIHQHLNIGEGEIDWNIFFKTLREVRFDGIMTSQVFAWEERNVDSSRSMRSSIQRYLDKYPAQN